MNQARPHVQEKTELEPLPRRRWLPLWRPRNVGRLFAQVVRMVRPSKVPVTPAAMLRLSRAERRGEQLAILCRTMAFGVALLWYIIIMYLSGRTPTPWGVLALVALTALGVFHFIAVGTRFHRRWFAYAATAIDLLAICALFAFAPVSRSGEVPQIYAFRTNGIYMLLPFIALSALSLSPRIVLWAGVVAVVAWWSAFVFVVSGMEETISWSDLPVAAPRDVYDAVFLSPNFIGFGSRMQESIAILVSALVLAVAVARARQLFFAQIRAEAAREEERAARATITAQLGRFVPSAIAKRLIDNPAGLAPQVRHAAVLVMDIRDFTQFAEGRDPGAVIAELNHFLARCAECVSDFDGVVITFTGDGLLATFNTPIDIDAPEQAALAAARRLVDCGAEHGFPVRVGVAAGPLAAGSVGSNERQAFTVYGDTVNRASRLETLAKTIDHAILVDQGISVAVSEDLSFVGHHEVRGFHEPVAVWSATT
ncbi:MAG: adenylate/guanylate cyclase domain-containing protein [Devosia sp.]